MGVRKILVARDMVMTDHVWSMSSCVWPTGRKFIWMMSKIPIRTKNLELKKKLLLLSFAVLSNCKNKIRGYFSQPIFSKAKKMPLNWYLFSQKKDNLKKYNIWDFCHEPMLRWVDISICRSPPRVKTSVNLFYLDSYHLRWYIDKDPDNFQPSHDEHNKCSVLHVLIYNVGPVLF